MSKERSLVFKKGVALQTAPGVARLVTPDHEDININDERTLGLLAEWLAAAWENVAGEPYEHQEYDKSLEATVKAGEWVIPKAAITDKAFNEGMDTLEAFAKVAHLKHETEDGNGLYTSKLAEAIEIGKQIGRDEDALELARAAVQLSSDPGPGGYSYGRERVLERDCE